MIVSPAKRGGPRIGLAGRHLRRVPLLVVAAMTAAWLLLTPGGGLGGRLQLQALLADSTSETAEYRSPAARELLPGLQQRPEQVALERRWGVTPVLQARPAPAGARIPRILHHVYFPSIPGFLEAATAGSAATREELAQSCRRMHPGWQYVSWDWEAATQLVDRFYPAYAAMFQRLDSVIKRADAVRYFIMHAMGGLYLDLDIECFQPADSWLADYDVVLQDPGPTNGVVASVPGHPLWLKVLELMRERVEEDPQRGVVELTGPGLMSTTFKFHLGPDGPREREGQPDPWSGEHRIGGSRVMVYPQGRYYHPCEWDNAACHLDLAIQRALGRSNLTQLAGYHRFAASWAGGNNAGILSEEQLKQQLCGSA